MITTVTLNPAIDKSILLDEVKLGEVHRIKEVIETAGGKGINVSKVLNLLGAQNTAAGIFGKDNANFFKDFFDSQSIKHDFYEVDGKTRTNVKVIETARQRTTDLNEPGVEVSQDDLKKISDKLIKLSKSSDYMVLSGSLPMGIPDDYYANIINAVKGNTKVVLDTSGKRLKAGIKAGAYIIKPNKEELKQAYQTEFNSNKECIDFCIELIKNSQLNIVLLTLGGEGAVFITEDKIYYSDPVDVTVVNTVGAGDSFLGGYLSGKDKQLSDDEAFKMAAACGTCAVMQKGTDVFTKEEYDEIIKQVIIR